MVKILKDVGTGFGLTDLSNDMFAYSLLIIGIVIIAMAANYIVKRILLKIVEVFVRQSKTKWDDVLLERKFFSRISRITPALIFYFSSSFFGDFGILIQRIAVAYILFSVLLVVFAFLNALVDIYQSYEVSRQRPLKGYAQILKIIFSIFLAIVIISILIGESPVLLLSGLGAMTAVLLLIFKDTILGLVASIQITMNNTVQVGDWIEMPKYSADGDIIDISLHTIKVQNWDKTITMIPSYAFVSDGFKNWRGMSESGGRRIKRSINIDMTSIKFLDESLLERFKNFQLINNYIEDKKKEIAEFNKVNKINKEELINGRHLTNIGTFRAYIKAYLGSHPDISKDMTFMIRQLKPTEQGLPIELYVFSKVQNWVSYEGIQSDIMDHLLASVPLFDLRIFQHPTGQDFKSLRSS